MFMNVLKGRYGATVAVFAVVALMAVSVGTVHAVVVQDGATVQEEQAEKETAEKKRRAERATEMKEALRARLGRVREMAREAQGHAGMLRARARAGQSYGRLARTPRVELRGLRGMWGGNAAERALRMSEELELTDAQEEQIRSARHNHRRAAIERDAQIEMLDLDLDEMLEDRNTADLNAVEDLMQQRASLRVQAEISGMRLSRDVWGILTPEQQETFEDSRGGIFRLRGGDGANLFLHDDDTFSWSHDLGEIFDSLDFGEFDGDFGGVFEFKSDDGEPFIWRWGNEFHDDDDHDRDDDDEDDEGETQGAVGTAIGI